MNHLYSKDNQPLNYNSIDSSKLNNLSHQNPKSTTLLDNYGSKVMMGIRSVADPTEVKLLYIGVLMLTLIMSLQTNLQYSLFPRALEEFQSISFSSTLSVIISLLGVLLAPIISKIVDYFGRSRLLFISIIIFFIGLLIAFFSKSFIVFSLAYFIISIGSIGYENIKSIFIADITSLSDRSYLLALDNVPFVLNTWIGTLAATPIDKTIGWRWAFGIPAILLIPFSFLLFFMLFKLQKKAYVTLPSLFEANINLKNKIRFILKELDFIGLILLTMGTACVLLPMNIAGNLSNGWNTFSMILLEVIGALLLVGLIIWEKDFARIPLIPLDLFNNPTSIGAFLIVFFIALDSGMNYSYLTTYFMISRKIGLTYVNILMKGFQMSYMISALMIGPIIKKLNDYKKPLIVGATINCFGLFLMIPARLPHSSDLFIVITQILCGFGMGIIDICIVIAYQGSISRKSISIATASMTIVKGIAGCIGESIAGSIWTQMIPRFLREALGPGFDVRRAMNEFNFNWDLPPEQFEKVVTSFGYGQMYITLISCCMAIIGLLLAILIMKPFNVNEVQKFNDCNNSEDNNDC